MKYTKLLLGNAIPMQYNIIQIWGKSGVVSAATATQSHHLPSRCC